MKLFKVFKGNGLFSIISNAPLFILVAITALVFGMLTMIIMLLAGFIDEIVSFLSVDNLIHFDFVGKPMQATIFVIVIGGTFLLFMFQFTRYILRKKELTKTRQENHEDRKRFTAGMIKMVIFVGFLYTLAILISSMITYLNKLLIYLDVMSSASANKPVTTLLTSIFAAFLPGHTININPIHDMGIVIDQFGLFDSTTENTNGLIMSIIATIVAIPAMIWLIKTAKNIYEDTVFMYQHAVSHNKLLATS